MNARATHSAHHSTAVRLHAALWREFAGASPVFQAAGTAKQYAREPTVALPPSPSWHSCHGGRDSRSGILLPLGVGGRHRNPTAKLAPSFRSGVTVAMSGVWHGRVLNRSWTTGANRRVPSAPAVAAGETAPDVPTYERHDITG